MYVQSGCIVIVYGHDEDINNADDRMLVAGESFHIPVGLIHRIIAIDTSEVFEFSTQHFEDLKTENRSFILVDYIQQSFLLTGSSPYPAVNLRRSGLKRTNLGMMHFRGLEKIINPKNLLDLRVENDWSEYFFEIVDKKKFMLAKIKHGI
jgi:hypothetical protein